MGITDDVKQTVGMKEKSGMDKMADKARSSVDKMKDDVKGALGMKPKTDKYYDYGLLVLRIAISMIALHGIMKLMSLDGTAAFFGKLGIPIAGVMAVFIALLETVGGICILLGIATRVFGVLLACEFVVAILLTNPFKGIMPHEAELWFLLTGIAIALTGPGKYSLREKLAGDKKDSILNKI
jgi:putative oxidoreductase